MDRDAAVDRLEAVLETVEAGDLPVPVREVWTYGDVALGLDPVERLEVYVTKDLMLRDDDAGSEPAMREELGVRGIGRTVRADWARAHPELVRANDAGYAAPEKCLAAQLLPDDEPVHLEVCNTGFEDNVRQRLLGAEARGAYEEVLDPRGVCLWVEGEHSPTALDRLRRGDLVFPTLAEALEMLGLEADEAEAAAAAVQEFRAGQAGATVRGDVV
ncbi:MAG: hypothetical protein U5J98_06715 [Halobacteriales archaeon]|nr:hypothetical protein [Halobacteriales archaeon]